jgi:hypothetical protein
MEAEIPTVSYRAKIVLYLQRTRGGEFLNILKHFFKDKIIFKKFIKFL